MTRLPTKSAAPLVGEFAAWAREQRGLAETTLATYLAAIAPFVDALGDIPAAYEAMTIRAYMSERAKTVSVATTKGIWVGIRAFLRFLIATGRCPSGLDHAMPNAAGWRLASIPRFLPDADIARMKLQPSAKGLDGIIQRIELLIIKQRYMLEPKVKSSLNAGPCRHRFAERQQRLISFTHSGMGHG